MRTHIKKTIVNHPNFSVIGKMGHVLHPNEAHEAHCQKTEYKQDASAGITLDSIDLENRDDRVCYLISAQFHAIYQPAMLSKRTLLEYISIQTTFVISEDNINITFVKQEFPKSS